MPVWRIYHPPTTFAAPAERRALAQALTRIYTNAGLPGFYVNIFFVPLGADCMFVSGEPVYTESSSACSTSASSSLPSPASSRGAEKDGGEERMEEEDDDGKEGDERSGGGGEKDGERTTARRKKPPFVQFVYTHVARNFADREAARRFLDKVNAVLKPFVADKGYDWEVHGCETPRELWRCNGLEPPDSGSAAERLWIQEDRPVPYALLTF